MDNFFIKNPSLKKTYITKSNLLNYLYKIKNNYKDHEHEIDIWKSKKKKLKFNEKICPICKGTGKAGRWNGSDWIEEDCHTCVTLGIIKLK